MDCIGDLVDLGTRLVPLCLAAAACFYLLVRFACNRAEEPRGWRDDIALSVLALSALYLFDTSTIEKHTSEPPLCDNVLHTHASHLARRLTSECQDFYTTCPLTGIMRTAWDRSNPPVDERYPFKNLSIPLLVDQIQHKHTFFTTDSWTERGRGEYLEQKLDKFGDCFQRDGRSWWRSVAWNRLLECFAMRSEKPWKRTIVYTRYWQGTQLRHTRELFEMYDELDKVLVIEQTARLEKLRTNLEKDWSAAILYRMNTRTLRQAIQARHLISTIVSAHTCGLRVWAREQRQRVEVLRHRFESLSIPSAEYPSVEELRTLLKEVHEVNADALEVMAEKPNPTASEAWSDGVQQWLSEFFEGMASKEGEEEHDKSVICHGHGFPFERFFGKLHGERLIEPPHRR